MRSGHHVAMAAYITWTSRVSCGHHALLQAGITRQRHTAAPYRYLLAMVIAYFSRAGLFSWQFRPIHFFLALYLANDMEEDNQAPKQDMFYILYGKSYIQHPMFHKLRFQLIRSMGWRTWVSREECEEVGIQRPLLDHASLYACDAYASM
ncbi:hypothetical protein STEG23_023293 [Scotinomys teguina]